MAFRAGGPAMALLRGRLRLPGPGSRGHARLGRSGAAAQPAAEEPGEDAEVSTRKKTFAEVQAERLDQAERTVLIKCPSRLNEKKLLQYLSSHGNVKSHFFFENRGISALIEFSEKSSIASLQDAVGIPSASEHHVVPFKSRLFTFTLKNPVSQHLEETPLHLSPQSHIPVKNLIEKLCLADSISSQMYILLDEYQLTEENIRLRFLACSLVRDFARAYFPDSTVKPFGSSVNTFGKLGSDVDMFLDFRDTGKHATKMKKGPFEMEYQMKRLPSERLATQRILSVIGDCLDNFGPGCANVQKILNARCPLVKFSHQPTGFQCDLSVSNSIAIRSSELLYIYGCLDSRVRALVFTIRCWARVHGLTNSAPGTWITNFSLTMMVMFFLQRRSPPIIPTLDQLKELAGEKDKHIIGGYDCSFVSDLRKIKPTKNTETLDVLLSEFFEYFGNFDFRKNSINLRKGKEVNKPESSPLYIWNPFEQDLNISKNVNQPQLEKFIAMARESAWILQKEDNTQQMINKEPWGLAALLIPFGKNNSSKMKNRMKGIGSETIRSLLDSLKLNSASSQQKAVGK
ncbi:poly(A) RNA polymerase, mitochondrial [Ammospiza nelsoni]|uniref:poly(A) RNA polymerase, mitochondrial n=1 Tax=Ammospiza caudacuta TaxID=2857398 RepID=UPI00273A507F|nr:poly(A) RNA polymerase, mitochondrial [Ammospiza caudacuta]XP_059335306.1 poly(A) RNA polymerase, mitochondrial [Ammospiza nelsoni]